MVAVVAVVAVAFYPVSRQPQRPSSDVPVYTAPHAESLGESVGVNRFDALERVGAQLCDDPAVDAALLDQVAGRESPFAACSPARRIKA